MCDAVAPPQPRPRRVSPPAVFGGAFAIGAAADLLRWRAAEAARAATPGHRRDASATQRVFGKRASSGSGAALASAAAAARVGCGVALWAAGSALCAFYAQTMASRGVFLDSRGARPPERLLTDGAFAVSRHPFYASMLLAYAGVAIGARMPVTLLLLGPCVAVVQSFAVEKEEAELRTRFGDDYGAYARTVRQWL